MTSFTHEITCPRDGWLTKPEMARLLGVGVTQFDRTYARHGSNGPGGEVKRDGQRSLYHAQSYIDNMTFAGVWENGKGPTVQTITCGECGATLGAVKPPAFKPITPPRTIHDVPERGERHAGDSLTPRL